MAWGLAVVSLVAGLVAAAARPAITDSPGSTVKEPFRVVDSQGKTRVLIEALPKLTRLRLLDSEGAVMANLACGPGLSGKKDASLAIFDEKGVPVASIGTGTWGVGGRIDVCSELLAGGASLTYDAKGGSLNISGPGQGAANVLTDEDGGQLRLRDKKGDWVSAGGR